MGCAESSYSHPLLCALTVRVYAAVSALFVRVCVLTAVVLLSNSLLSSAHPTMAPMMAPPRWAPLRVRIGKQEDVGDR